MDRYEITKTCSEMLDPWVVHGYKSLSCNNFLNPSQFYQQGVTDFMALMFFFACSSSNSIHLLDGLVAVNLVTVLVVVLLG